MGLGEATLPAVVGLECLTQGLGLLPGSSLRAYSSQSLLCSFSAFSPVCNAIHLPLCCPVHSGDEMPGSQGLRCSTSCEMTLKDATAGSRLLSLLFYLWAWCPWLNGSSAYFSFFTQSCLWVCCAWHSGDSSWLRPAHVLGVGVFTGDIDSGLYSSFFFLTGSQLLYSQGWPWTFDLLLLSPDIHVVWRTELTHMLGKHCTSWAGLP